MTQKQRFQRSESRGHFRPRPGIRQRSFPTRHVLRRRGARCRYQYLLDTVSGGALDREGKEHANDIDNCAGPSGAIVLVREVQVLVTAGQLVQRCDPAKTPGGVSPVKNLSEGQFSRVRGGERTE